MLVCVCVCVCGDACESLSSKPGGWADYSGVFGASRERKCVCVCVCVGWRMCPEVEREGQRVREVDRKQDKGNNGSVVKQRWSYSCICQCVKEI